MYKKIFLVSVMAISLSLSVSGQKCEKFINYQTRVIDTKGLSLKTPGGPANLLPINISSLQRTTSERLEMLDMLQYNLCQKMANIKIPVLKETMQVEYSNFLMEMMNKLTSEISDGTAIDAPPHPDRDKQGEGITDKETTPLPQREEKPNAPVSAGKVRISFPCKVSEADGVIRAFGMEESTDPQLAKQIATTVALSELASKVEITVKSAIDYHVKRNQNNQDEEFEKRYEMRTEQSVQQTIRGWKAVCEEFELDPATNKYTCYVVIEISEESVVAPIYNELTKDNDLKKMLPSINAFTDVVKSMNNIRKGNSLYFGF